MLDISSSIFEKGRVEGREEQKNEVIVKMLKREYSFEEIMDLVDSTEEKILEIQKTLLN